MISAIFAKLWDIIVRLRTWVVNGGAAFLVLILPLLGAPEIMAVVPTEYHRYIIAAAFVINIMLRPRPASRQTDPEVQVAKEMKSVAKAEAVVVTVQGAESGVTHAEIVKEQK